MRFDAEVEELHVGDEVRFALLALRGILLQTTEVLERKRLRLISTRTVSVLGVLCLLTAVAVLISTFFVSWYGMGPERFEFLLLDWNKLFGITSYHVPYTDAGMFGPVGDLMQLMTALVIAAIVLGIVGTASLLLKASSVAFASGLAAAVTLSALALVFYLAMPRALHESPVPYQFGGNLLWHVHGFEGGYSGDYYNSIEWGPMAGWWLLVLALGMSCMGAYLTWVNWRRATHQKT